MKVNENSLVPIYVQIANAIEEDILNDKLSDGDSCYSQLIIAKELNVNPATAAKGINLLVSRGMLEKQRGQAMIVASGAKTKIIERKKHTDFEDLLEEIVISAKRLGLSEDYVVNKISEYFKGENK